MYAIPTEEELNTLNAYLTTLVESGFGMWDCDYADWTAEKVVYDWERDHRDELRNHCWHMHTGASKVVIVFDDLNWVIKANMPGYHLCDQEVENWNRAIRDGWERYFAAVYKFAEFYGISFYIQERATPDEDYYSGKCYDYFTSELRRDEDDYDEEWDWDCSDADRIEALLDIHGSNFSDLVYFCDSYDINDLHYGNFGESTLDGRTVIFDYSGF